MLAPCTVKEALRRVRQWHRHLPRLQGGLFAVKLVDEDWNCLGVAIAGNPSRTQQGHDVVITRVATLGAENACSMLYGALCRAAKALGYRRAWTYTLPDEPGTSLRAAGFVDMGMTDGGDWGRPSRARAPAERPEPKRRWLRELSPEPVRMAGTTFKDAASPRRFHIAARKASSRSPTPSSAPPQTRTGLVMTENPEPKSPCDDCGRMFDHRQLDAVWLDAEHRKASAEAYCRDCFPKHIRVPGDRWQALDAPDAHGNGGA